MSGGLPTPAQRRPYPHKAPNRKKTKRPSLARQHAQQLNAWQATTDRMRTDAHARIRAEVHTLFANRWAEVMKLRGRPDFAARVAALEAEQQATLQDMLRRRLGTLRSERAATRALMLDNQRRQRKAAAAAERDALLARSPALAAAELLARLRQARLARQFMFAFAGRVTTTRGLARFMASPMAIRLSATTQNSTEPRS